MTRAHVVRITVLTACVYAFSIYMQKGTWIFPIPLYELALFPAIIALYIAGKERPGAAGILALSWSFLHLVASQFVLEFFLDDDGLRWFYDHFVSDYLLLLYILLFTVWSWVISLKAGTMWPGVISGLAATVFAACFVLGSPYWAMIPLVLFFVMRMFTDKDASVHRNILFLFTFFYLSRYLTLYFLGSEM